VTDVPPHEKTPDTGIGRPVAHKLTHYDVSLGVDQRDPIQPDLREPLEIIDMLQSWGVSMLNVTIGSPYWCPHVQRPATYPPSDGYLPPEHPLRGVQRHLETTRAVKEANPDLLVVGSGYSYLQEWLPHVAAAEVEQGHVDMIGLGRMVLSYPHFPRDIVDGRQLDRACLCRTFSDCTTAPRNGEISGCYPLDEYYKTMPQAITIKGLRRKAMGRT
jgi:2,4-dienoyl-CoA reductase-like NADH-dependent reductase (Old Yellow Enzyme family)